MPTGELVIGGRAARVMRGHNGDVVDLSWSPNQFLLSAGRDGSLRLWHPGRLGCVHLFPQTGAATPTSCAFHPRLENSFATSGEDGKVRTEQPRGDSPVVTVQWRQSRGDRPVVLDGVVVCGWGLC